MGAALPHQDTRPRKMTASVPPANQKRDLARGGKGTDAHVVFTVASRTILEYQVWHEGPQRLSPEENVFPRSALSSSLLLHCGYTQEDTEVKKPETEDSPAESVATVTHGPLDRAADVAQRRRPTS